MQKNNDNSKERMELIEEYKKSFSGLSENQQALLAFRKVIEMRRDSSFLYDYGNYKQSKEKLSKIRLKQMDELLAIIEASDFNSKHVKLFLLYARCNIGRNYKNIYTDSLVSYDKVLENYKKLAEELHLDTSLELSHLFTYMLWNGYFSVTKTHCYKLQERLLLPGMNSFDVIKGKGVCLGYAEFLHHYLRACSKESALLVCKVSTGKNNISQSYYPEIERNVQNSHFSKILQTIMTPFIKGLVNNFGNHSVVLIAEGNKFYVYCPTNLYVLNIINENIATIINGKGEFELKPLETLILHPDSDPNQLFERMFLGDIEPAFTRKELILSFENTMELIKENINLLDGAYDNIHSELEVIDKQTDEIGGSFKALRKIRKIKEEK